MTFYIYFSQEIDIERRLERIECVITNFPAVIDTIEIADEVAIMLDLLSEISLFALFNTSGKKTNYYSSTVNCKESDTYMHANTHSI